MTLCWQCKVPLIGKQYMTNLWYAVFGSLCTICAYHYDPGKYSKIFGKEMWDDMVYGRSTPRT